MGTLDLGMGDEADAEARRLEEERRRRRAAEGVATAPPGQDDAAGLRSDPAADAAQLRSDAGYDDAALEQALRGLQVPAPEQPAQQGHRMTTSPQFTPEERGRIGGVEARLQSGERAGVARDAERDMAGTPAAPPSAPQPTAAPPAAPRRTNPGAMRALSEMRPDASANPVTGAIKSASARGAERDAEQNAAALDARWTQRIEEVETMMQQARDQRTRAVLGSLLMNLVRGAAHALAGTQSSAGPIRPDLDAFERRAQERLSDRTREWDASDDMLVRVQDIRDRQRGRTAEALQAGDRARREQQGLDLERVREERQARIAASRERLAEAESEQQRQEAMRALMHDDPASDESGRARDRFAIAVMGLPPTMRAGYGETEAEIAARVRGLSAGDIEALERQLPRVSGGVRTSRAGGGGGGAGAPRPGSSVAGDVQIDELVAAGRLTDEQAAQMRAALASPDRRARAEAQSALQRLMPGQGETREVMPGLTVDLDIPNAEAGSLRRQFGDAQASWGTLGRVRQLAQQYGSSAVLNPEAIRRIETEMVPLRAMVARIQGTGVINPGERPLIDAVLPDPSSFSGQALGTYMAALDQWERQALADIDARFLPYVREDRADEVRSILRRRIGAQRTSGSAGARAAPTQTGPRFSITSPDGRTTSRPLTPEQRRVLEGRGYTVTEAR
jgi:hypothetical protein